MTRKNLPLNERLELIRPVLKAKEGVLTREDAQALAEQCGVSARQIRRDANAELDESCIDGLGSREQLRAKTLSQLDSAIDLALVKESYTAVSSLIGQRIKLLGLDVPPAFPVASTDDPAETSDTDPLKRLERLLSDTRALRMDAQAKGSLIAAQKLLVSEGELESKVQLLIEERKRMDESVASDEAILDAVVEAVSRLPLVLVKKLIAALQDMTDAQ